MKEKYLKGTTTVGLIYSDGIVLAADKRATMGFFVSDKEARKIYKIDEHVAITTAGLVGDAQAIVRWLIAESKIYRMTIGKRITIKGLTTLLANILHNERLFPFYTQFIVGGYDSKPRIFELDPLGGICEKKFSSTGSGSPVAYGVLESEYREDMEMQNAVKLALKAMSSALKRDAATGDGIDMVIITEKEFKRFSEEDIRKLAKTK